MFRVQLLPVPGLSSSPLSYFFSQSLCFSHSSSHWALSFMSNHAFSQLPKIYGATIFGLSNFSMYSEFFQSLKIPNSVPMTQAKQIVEPSISTLQFGHAMLLHLVHARVHSVRGWQLWVQMKHLLVLSSSL